VIKESSIRYKTPVTQDFTATAFRPPQDAIDKFLTTLKSKSLARLEISGQVETENGICCLFRGIYVALHKKL
jgi:thioesterase domain-containing protein